MLITKKSTLIKIGLFILFLGLLEPSAFIGTGLHKIFGYLRYLAFFISLLTFLRYKLYEKPLIDLLLMFLVLLGVSTYLYSGEFTADFAYFFRTAVAAIILVAYGLKRFPKSICFILGFILTVWLVLDACTWVIPGLGVENSDYSISCFLGTKTTITYYFLPALAFDYAYYYLCDDRRKEFGKFMLVFAFGGTIAYLVQMPISTTIVCVALELLIVIFIRKKHAFVDFACKFGFLITAILNALLTLGGSLGFLNYIIVNILGETLDLNGRRQIWSLVLWFFSQRPFIGYGMGSTVRFDVWQKNNASAHNYYLTILFMGGVIAMFVYMVFIMCVHKKNRRYLHTTLWRFLMLTLVLMNIEGITENYGYNVMTICFLTLLACIDWVFEYKACKSKELNLEETRWKS